jgi:hypothetical protein
MARLRYEAGFWIRWTRPRLANMPQYKRKCARAMVVSSSTDTILEAFTRQTCKSINQSLSEES